MRAVVTGGAGFIGSHVAEALAARGDEVHVLDNLSTGRREHVPAGVRLHVGDIREDADLDLVFDEARPELCFHLAAQADVGTSVAEPVYDAEVNVLGTLRVLEAARRYEAQVVFSSTGGAIYGECDGPATEDAPRQAAGLEGGVVAIFLERMAAGEPTTIYGDGSQTRDFVHVGDVVRAVLAAAGHDGGVFNIGTGVELPVAALHEACLRVAGSARPPEHAPARPGDLLRSVLDPGLAAAELGWQAETGLEDGLAETWDWVRSVQ